MKLKEAEHYLRVLDGDIRKTHPLLAEYIRLINTRDSLSNLHIPHSDVFYIRAAIQDKYGVDCSLESIEQRLEELMLDNS